MDLWPEVMVAASIQTPIAILSEQADILGCRTNRLIEAIVDQPAEARDDRFAYEFLISVENLEYRYSPFRVEHSIDLYPVKIFLQDDDIAKEVVGRVSSTNPWTTCVAKTEQEFLETLGKIFTSEKMKRLLGALLAQVEVAYCSRASNSRQGQGSLSIASIDFCDYVEAN
jgi:hypothetical protein